MQHLDPKHASARFSDVLRQVHNDPNGIMVTPFDPNEVAGMSACIVAGDYDAGVLVSSDNEICGLYNWSAPSGTGAALTREAVRVGGRWLNCFEPLVPYYEALGFHVVAALAFDPAQAPDGWDYARNGRPDVVFMALERRPLARFDSYELAANYAMGAER